MELKTARLTVLIDPNKKAAFEHLCASQDRTPSQVVRQLIRDYLAAHGVGFVASGAPPAEPAPAPAPARPRQARATPRTVGKTAGKATAKNGPGRRHG